MATIIHFPTNYPVHQWKVRLEIERFLRLSGEDPEVFMRDYGYLEKKAPEDFSDELLAGLLDYAQEEYALKQCGLSTAVTTEEAERLWKEGMPQTENPQPKRPARRIAFPMTPEMAARQKTAQAAKPKKDKTAKAEKPAVQPEDKEQAAKGNYIRRVKMLQRDCEKTLPRFDDDTYRAILAEQFDAKTSKALSIPQLRALLLHMKGLLRECQTSGKASPTASFDAPALLHHDATGLNRCGSMRKIQALLAEKGKVEGKYIRWSYALGILKRQTGGVVSEWEKATPANLNAVIAALSKDAQRKGRRTQ